MLEALNATVSVPLVSYLGLIAFAIIGVATVVRSAVHQIRT